MCEKITDEILDKKLEGLSLKEAYIAVQIQRIQQEIIKGIKEIRKKAEEADLHYKSERGKIMEIKRKMLEGEYISREDAMNQALRMLEDVYSEVMDALKGIAKNKQEKIKRIFNRYME